MNNVMVDQYGKDTANEYENIVVNYAYDYENCLDIVCREIFVVQGQHRFNVENFSVLDLGAGTGRLSRKIAKQAEILGKECEVRFDLLDSSLDMLTQARELWDSKFNCNTVQSDLSSIEENVSGGYDLIVSSFALHHLVGAEKELCFKRIYNLLTPGGIFVVADRMVDEDSSAYADHLRVVGEKAYPLFEKITGRSLVGSETSDIAHQQFKNDGDSPESVEKHMSRLNSCGFTRIKNPYMNYGNAVVVAERGLN